MASLAENTTELAPLHTATATETSQPFIVLPGPVTGIQIYNQYQARVQYLNALQASGSGVWTFTAQISYNRGTTWVTNATGAAITLTSTVQAAEQVLNINPNQPTDTGQIWLWVLATLSGSPVSPSISYRVDLLRQ